MVLKSVFGNLPRRFLGNREWFFYAIMQRTSFRTNFATETCEYEEPFQTA